MKKLDQFLLQKRQIERHEYKVIIFENNRAIGYCIMTLLPHGDEAEHPSFQFTKHEGNVPKSFTVYEKEISKWIEERHRFF